MHQKTLAWSVALAMLATVAVPGQTWAADDNQLHIYNWSDYIAPDTVARFEKETGIKVTYDVYDSNEVLEAKLLAGKSGYDLVVPSANPYMARQIQAGVYKTIDKSKLANYGNLDPKILANVAGADPGNAHGVPYLWGTTGLGYNIAKVKAAAPGVALDSIKLLFDPETAKKLSGCGIEVLDTPQELVPAALVYLGRDPLSRDEKDLEAAVGALQKIRPYIRKFHSSQYINDLANGDACLAFGYSGDVLQARSRATEAKNGVEIGYSIPREGAMLWVDMMGIPADAPHPDKALAFINFILRPEIAGAISNTVSYANPNTLSLTFVEDDIKDDPEIYPPDEVRAKLFTDRPVSQAYERQRTRAWTRLKSGS